MKILTEADLRSALLLEDVKNLPCILRYIRDAFRKGSI